MSQDIKPEDFEIEGKELRDWDPCANKVRNWYIL